MNALLLQHSSIISQPDTMLVPIMQQTAVNNTTTTDNLLGANPSIHGE
jgi:hypothetical protein